MHERGNEAQTSPVVAQTYDLDRLLETVIIPEQQRVNAQKKVTQSDIKKLLAAKSKKR